MRTKIGSREPSDRTRRSSGLGDARTIRELGLRLLRLYYWATPLFFIADSVLGVSVRASFLPRADLRLAYYGFCLACAVACQLRPGWAPAIGMGESGLSLLLIALGVLLPIWDAPAILLAGGDMPAIFPPGKLANVLLSGSMVVVAFHRQKYRLEQQLGLTGQAPAEWRPSGRF